MEAANNILLMIHVFCECMLKEAYIMQHCQFNKQHFDMEWTMHLLDFTSLCNFKETISITFFKIVH